jgi:hypothetical protein
MSATGGSAAGSRGGSEEFGDEADGEGDGSMKRIDDGRGYGAVQR